MHTAELYYWHPAKWGKDYSGRGENIENIKIQYLKQDQEKVGFGHCSHKMLLLPAHLHDFHKDKHFAVILDGVG